MQCGWSLVSVVTAQLQFDLERWLLCGYSVVSVVALWVVCCYSRVGAWLLWLQPGYDMIRALVAVR
jgi:hypothetical protein